MPETIRTANERLRSRPWRRGFLAAIMIAVLCFALGTPARADAGFALGVIDAVHDALAALGQQQIATLTLTLGLLCFAALATVVLLRTRKAADRVEAVARDEARARHAEIDRLKTLLLSEPQVLVE